MDLPLQRPEKTGRSVKVVKIGVLSCRVPRAKTASGNMVDPFGGL